MPWDCQVPPDSIPSTPTTLGTLPSLDSTRGVQAVGNLAFLAEGMRHLAHANGSFCGHEGRARDMVDTGSDRWVRPLSYFGKKASV